MHTSPSLFPSYTRILWATVHSLFVSINLNIISHIRLDFRGGFFRSGCLTKILESFPIPTHPYCMRFLFKSPWFDLPNNVWWRVQIMKLSIKQFPPHSYYFLYLVFSSALCSQTTSVYVVFEVLTAVIMKRKSDRNQPLCYFPRLRNQVSQSYRITSNV
jgi:hypothetical protein